MLMTPKSQRQVCHCLPSQDAVPSQLKACRGDCAPGRDVHLCPEPGKGECRGNRGWEVLTTNTTFQEDIRDPAATRTCGQWGAAGQLFPLHNPPFNPRTGQPPSTAHSPAHPCPSGCSGLAGTEGRCALLQKELMGERMSQTITVWKVSPGSLVK